MTSLPDHARRPGRREAPVDRRRRPPRARAPPPPGPGSRRGRRPAEGQAQCARTTRATSPASSQRTSRGSPELRTQNAGSSDVPNPRTGTPSVSSASSVFGRSRTALAPDATTDDPRARELEEVGRDVEGLRRAAVDAADPARREDADSRRRRDRHRRRDRRRAALPPRGEEPEVARRRLPHGAPGAGQRLRLGGGEAGARHAVDDRDEGGDGPFPPNGLLRRPVGLEVRGERQAVAEDRRLERDDGPSLGEGPLHLARRATTRAPAPSPIPPVRSDPFRRSRLVSLRFRRSPAPRRADHRPEATLRPRERSDPSPLRPEPRQARSTARRRAPSG